MAQAPRSIIDKWDLMKMKSFCKAKGTISRTKCQPKDGEKIFMASTSYRGLIFKECKELKNLDSRKSNNPIKKCGTELNREFTSEDSKMAEQHLKKCSMSLVVREIQIKMTFEFYLIPIRISEIKNSGSYSRFW